MNDLIPNFDDRETTASLLLLAEIITKRGEKGPLARVFACRPRPKPVVEQNADPGEGVQESEPK